MRLHEFITEAKQIDPENADEMPESKMARVARSAFATVYPGVKLYAKDDNGSGYIFLSTNEDPMALTQYTGGYGHRTGEDYYLCLGVSTYDGEISVNIVNATAGDYKGVTAKIIQALFTAAQRQWGIPVKNVLNIKGDSSGGVWERIAGQLGVEYAEDDN